MLLTLRRFVVTLAIVVLGLSGCSSPLKSVKSTPASNEHTA